MSRKRARVKGRLGGEVELFAKLPQSVMQAPALACASHPAFRLLVILIAGKTPQQNGRLAVTNSHARTHGMTSHDTIQRAREELLARRLIVCTRPGRRLNKNPALYAVTWLPICSRDGQPVDPPEPASHAYLDWKEAVPVSGTEKPQPSQRRRPSSRDEPSAADDFSPSRPAGRLVPAVGMVTALHRPDLGGEVAFHHPGQRENSEISEGAPHTARPAGAEQATVGEAPSASVLAFSTAKQKPSLAQPEAPAPAAVGRTLRSLHRDEPESCDAEFPETAEDFG